MGRVFRSYALEPSQVEVDAIAETSPSLFFLRFSFFFSFFPYSERVLFNCKWYVNPYFSNDCLEIFPFLSNKRTKTGKVSYRTAWIIYNTEDRNLLLTCS